MKMDVRVGKGQKKSPCVLQKKRKNVKTRSKMGVFYPFLLIFGKMCLTFSFWSIVAKLIIL